MIDSTRPAASSTPRQAVLALGALLLVSVVWGSSFPLTKQVTERLNPIDFISLRYVIAAVITTAVFHRALRGLSRATVRKGIILGVVVASGQLIWAMGIQHTSASVSGFITGAYVVLTPICAAILLKHRISRRWWSGAFIALIGLAVMSLNGFSLGIGEALTLVSALVFALHIVGLSHWSNPREAVGLAVVQIISSAVVFLFAALPGGFQTPSEGKDWAVLLYLAVMSSTVGMIVQSWAQAHLAATQAAVIMATEPVWAASLAIALIGEPLTWRIVIGGVCMVVAMIIVSLPERRLPSRPKVT